ncbi:prolyl oligopeptidase family serine peptidase [Exilibacterium tricleocarpae]|uniref:Prolyl oligopeptidase family serine peptidase n=1 Tax=Exilibacterium tricleocarpae TaxID=2591008 RepID=A0A545T8E7_9GAMM|nr:prolyl oligopeptidase family serine peptidase [Exilibacterium tricleocarpae]TQV73500.1 prolyl oligopeptidase family serine peptidase [Exilibacterium tricleocarpae]
MQLINRLITIGLGIAALGCEVPVDTSAVKAKRDSVGIEVYQRAERLMGPQLNRHVHNVFIVPHWVGDSDDFWYRREAKDSHEFMLVQAATGNQQSAFDHDAIAAGLSAAGISGVNAQQLPFTEFSYNADRSAIHFVIDAIEYQCQIATTGCQTIARAAAKPAPAGVLVSHNGKFGVETRADNNLWLLDLTTNDSRQLTFDGGENIGYGLYPDNRANFVPRYYARKNEDKKDLPANTLWSPDNRTVLVPLIDQRHVQPYPFMESVRKDGSFRPRVHNVRIPMIGEKPAFFVWYLVDTTTGKKQRVDLPYDQLLLIQQDYIAVRDVWWSDDASRLYMAAHGDNLESGFLFEVDITSGKSRTVIKETLSPRFDMNSSQYYPANVRILKDGAEALWWSQRSGWGHVYRYDIKTGRLLNAVTSGNWLVREIIDVDEQRNVMYFTAGDSIPGSNPYYRHLYRVNLDGTDLTLLTPEDADHLLLPEDPLISTDGITPYRAISPSGHYAVYNYSRVDQPTRFAISRITDGKVIAVVNEVDASGLYAQGWRPPEEFKVIAQDGKTELRGVIYKPSDFDPDKQYPIINAQYNSPLIAVAPRHFFQAYRGRAPLAPSSYAELGFIVVSLDARGTTYRSAAFNHYGDGKLNQIGLDDHVHAITELANTRPYMDIDRVGIVGFSYGGYTTIRAMLEYPEFFKVGVAGGPVADMHAMYDDFHWTAFHGKPRYGNGTRWSGDDKTEIPENFKSMASSLMADRLQGKLLLHFSELDENVPPAQVLQFVDALIANNKDFDMLYLPNRTHSFIAEGYIMRRQWDYMVEHLLGKTPPKQYKLDINRR